MCGLAQLDGMPAGMADITYYLAAEVPTAFSRRSPKNSMAHNIQSLHNNHCRNTFRFDFETRGFKPLENQRETAPH